MPKPSGRELRAIGANIVMAKERLRRNLPMHIREVEQAFVEVETFIAIALHVFSKTTPAKLNDAAMTVEIQARIKGREVIEERDTE
jgi:hypothetical protein